MFDIYQIVTGTKNVIYNGNIKLHVNIYKRFQMNERLERYVEIKKIIKEFLIVKKISPENIYILNSSVIYKNQRLETVIDLLEIQAFGLISDLFIDEEEEFLFRKNFKLYVGKKELSQENSCQRLIKILDCLIGDVYFGVNIIFENGCPQVSLIL